MDWECRVSCRDGSGRPAVLVVAVRADELVVTAPPGESAVLSPIEQVELCQALTQGFDEIRRHGQVLT
jgi:hypothetical protein